MKILILDPVGGASGDMILGSLIQLGCPQEFILSALQAVQAGPFKMRLNDKSVHGIQAVDLGFKIKPSKTTRTYRDIRALITESDLDPSIKAWSLEIFEVLAKAEAVEHGEAIDDIHFHEIGALDSILDIVGISAALAWFNPQSVYMTTIPLGAGLTTSMHGTIPLPAPATMQILEGLPVRFTEVQGELVTPTGAAVIKTLAKHAPIPEVLVKSVGYGCGDKEFKDWPNLFRSILCETPIPADEVFVVQTDVDDMVPEEWEAALARIMESGALDANLTPRIMKKGRPGTGLTVLVSNEKLEHVIKTVLLHTTSIGLRYYPVRRAVLARTEKTVTTRYGEVGIKEVIDTQGRMRRKAEYRDLKRIAIERNIPVARVRREIEADLTSGQDDDLPPPPDQELK
ncbi:MAG: nickel pincer cofactor biosynthesis protein LarC [Syntrophaceae bacterium]